jgi:predicted small metal-binding protein
MPDADAPLRVRCPRCEMVIAAADEDDLVNKVQAHVRNDHGLDHTMPRKHILARLRRIREADR